MVARRRLDLAGAYATRKRPLLAKSHVAPEL
jgi:hypothetical protein